MAEFVSLNKSKPAATPTPAGESKQPACESKQGEKAAKVSAEPDPHGACFDYLREKVAALQQDADKVFGVGGLAVGVDTSALVASQAWAAMDPKARAGRPGQHNALNKLVYSLKTVVTGSNGLIRWVQCGSNNRKTFFLRWKS